MFDKVKSASLGRWLAAAELLLVFVLALAVGALITQNGIKTTVSASESLVMQGVGLYIDGSFIAALDSEAEAEAVTDVLADRVAEAYGAPDGKHNLSNSVTVKSGTYSKLSFVDREKLYALLGGRDNGFSFDVYKADGTLTGITLEVMTVANTTAKESVEAPVVKVETDLLDAGESFVIKQGEAGICNNEYLVTYVNGEKTESVLVNSSVIEAPVAEEVLCGTQSGAMLMSAGDLFMLPCGGWISSWYGGRELWGQIGFHRGLDFAGSGASYGDPIYAAEDGIVSFAGKNGGYGNQVIIDHTKEISTLYAHCSKLAVSEGEFVRKGQIIAYVGNTGKVTGPHLHFEVRKNGVQTNPKKYIDWSKFSWYEVK